MSSFHAQPLTTPLAPPLAPPASTSPLADTPVARPQSPLRYGPRARFLIAFAATCLGTTLVVTLAMTIQLFIKVTSSGPPLGPGRRIYRVQPDEWIFLLLAIVAAPFFGWLITRLYRAPWHPPARTAKEPTSRLVWFPTAGAIALFGIAAIIIDRAPLVPGDRRILLVGWWPLCGIVLARIWLRTVDYLDRATLAARPGDALPCPGCAYDLRGLTDLKCPECGRVNTVDEVVLRRTKHL